MGPDRTIQVECFGSAVEALGWRSRRFPSDEFKTLGDLVAALKRDCQRLADAADRVRFAVNEHYATAETPLQAGDEVAIIPPVSGGASDARLSQEPIDLHRLTEEVSHATIGAIATFVGTVRCEKNPDGRILQALEYTAHESMALSIMEEIRTEAVKRHALCKGIVVHRLGPLRVGEASIAVVVAAAHRVPAFDACREIVEGVKASAPIFKREVWSDGSENWVQGI